MLQTDTGCTTFVCVLRVSWTPTAHPQKPGMNSSLDHPQGPSTSDTIHSEFHEAYLQEKKKKAGKHSFSALFSASWEPKLNTPGGSLPFPQICVTVTDSPAHPDFST